MRDRHEEHPSRRGIDRRRLLGALAALPAAAMASPAQARLTRPIPYGACVRGSVLGTDDAYRRLLAAQCDLIVPESELKWLDLRPSRGEFRFEAADAVADFARRQGIGMRGHTLAWYGALPKWTEALATRREAEQELARHIETVVGRYRGRIASWDVVNEPVVEDPARGGPLRDFVWSRLIGPDYMAFAFRRAAEADPAARLVLNEYDLECIGEPFARRRAAILAILRDLKARDVPVHALGLQGHLNGERQIDRDGFGAFLREVKGLGLDILVTELDVTDNTLPGDPSLRDALVAARAHDFLAAIAEVAPPKAILTWGITDKYTWVPIYFKRRDGQPNRPLPFDAEMRPKPLWRVVESFCKRVS